MANILTKLRARPDHHKKAIAFGVSFVITLAIVGVWLSTQNFFGAHTTVIAEAKAESPVSVMAQSAASAWKGLTNLFK